jgi:hypothetical protein
MSYKTAPPKNVPELDIFLVCCLELPIEHRALISKRRVDTKFEMRLLSLELRQIRVGSVNIYKNLGGCPYYFQTLHPPRMCTHFRQGLKLAGGYKHVMPWAASEDHAVHEYQLRRATDQNLKIPSLEESLRRDSDCNEAGLTIAIIWPDVEVHLLEVRFCWILKSVLIKIIT